MPYQQLLAELKSNSDEKYKNFHKRLLGDDSIKLIGVRVPILRRIAKRYKTDIGNLLSYPDEYYEVKFIKLTAVSNLAYNDFLKYIDGCVALIDNWATCDCFSAKCIEKNREDFLKYVRKYAAEDKEFYQRYALVTLLHFYVEERYLPEIYQTVLSANTNYYYVHMAAAWLVAETVTKCYDEAAAFLEKNLLDKRTHNKAIQKACESFRLSDNIKNYLKGLKR